MGLTHRDWSDKPGAWMGLCLVGTVHICYGYCLSILRGLMTMGVGYLCLLCLLLGLFFSFWVASPSFVWVCASCHFILFWHVQLKSLGGLIFSVGKTAKWISGRRKVGNLGGLKGGEAAVRLYCVKEKWIKIKNKDVKTHYMKLHNNCMYHHMYFNLWITYNNQCTGHYTKVAIIIYF